MNSKKYKDQCSICRNEDSFERGKLEGQKEILEIIDDDIKIQREMIEKYPQHKKSAEWRIIGFQLIKQKIKDIKTQEEVKK